MLKIMSILQHDEKEEYPENSGELIYSPDAPQFKMKLVSIHDEFRKVLAEKKNKKKGGATAEDAQQEERESPEKKPEEA